MNNLEFDEAKKVRKSLLIISASGILLKQLIKTSIGSLNFLGFEIPKN